jgi:hypothetical protein
MKTFKLIASDGTTEWSTEFTQPSDTMGKRVANNLAQVAARNGCFRKFTLSQGDRLISDFEVTVDLHCIIHERRRG